MGYAETKGWAAENVLGLVHRLGRFKLGWAQENRPDWRGIYGL